MVGLVIVSHSAKLADGIVELLVRMQPELPVRAAGGMPDGALGANADTILQAMHARASAQLVTTAARFQPLITLGLDGKQASARGMIDLPRLGARQGNTVHPRVSRPDAAVAPRDVVTLIERGFGEI